LFVVSVASPDRLLRSTMSNVNMPIDASGSYPISDAGTKAPTTQASATAFGGQLANTSATLASGYSNWNPGQSIGVSDARESARTGHPTNAPLGTGPAALLTAHAEPNAPVVSNGLDVTHIGENSELTNAGVPGPMRVLMAEEMVLLPSVFHLSIIKKVSSSVSQQKKPLIESGHPYKDQFNPAQLSEARGLQATSTTDMGARVGHHVAALNEYLTIKQHELFKKDIVRYRNLEPADIIQGVDDQAWTGWMIDGIVINETAVGGGSTRFTDGYERNHLKSMNFNSKTMPALPMKNVTTIRAGRSRMVDYFDGRGITPGSTQWLIVTKKVRAQRDHTYTLSAKAGPYSQTNGSGVVQRTRKPDDIKAAKALQGKTLDATAMYKALEHECTPFQLFFLSVPDGSSPPLAFKEWEDEWGCMHYNAHFIQISRLIFEPYQYIPLPSIWDPSDAAFHPFRNASDPLIRKLIEGVLLFPSKDGHRDIL
jgi:hypothetical protein